ncbi:MAG: MFS transporter [Bacteroidetes bacterium]|nr:MAG: MFS transporter [Bacteroidota bacterium]PTM11990.1 MAG: MFS transporter [Bacteroidota bacterium]
MTTKVNVQLSAMMFLEFFIWGAWFVTMGTFLGGQLKASDIEVGLAYQTQSVGAIIAPFVIGLIADRFFPAQRILGVLHLLGGFLLWQASLAVGFSNFYGYILPYMILYMPTLALVNSISFRQMQNPEKEFAQVRVLGTIGWIVAGLLIGYFNWEQANTLSLTFQMAAIASLLLGIFSFFLPHTPPPKPRTEKVSTRELLGLDALSLLKDRSFLVFFVASVLICIPLAFYYNFTNPFLNEIGVARAAAKMTLGQASEVLFMLLMPFFFVRLGVKKMLLVGMICWALRYVLFALGDADGRGWMLILGIALHGICYDFFFVTGQIYTDKQAGERFKSAAQGLITLATYGAGMFIGSLASGYIVNAYTTAAGHDWQTIWLIPAAFAGAIILLFSVAFKDQQT